MCLDFHLSACPLCAGSYLRLFTCHRYGACACQECGLRFLNPQPDDLTLKTIYTDSYFLGEKTPESASHVASLKSATAGLYLDMVYRHVSANAPTLLEVGCGCGEFLVEAQRRGFEVSGIEISSYAAETANHRLGIERVTVGTLGGVYLPETTFDVVVFADVIEHVRDPLEFLRRVYTLLKPGGIVFLVTPSLDSWSARLLGRRWMEYKVEHLFYFSRSTIQLALEKANFVRVTTLPNVKVLSVDYVYHHFRRFPVPMLTSWVALVRKLIPERFAHRHVRLVASGLVAIANKPQ